jgi:hypothetical protein
MPQRCLCYCSAAAFNIWFYTDDSTEITYAFGNHLVGQGAAEDKCQSVGGHLVTWWGAGLLKSSILPGLLLLLRLRLRYARLR